MPAMQAGLAKRCLSFRDIFLSRETAFSFKMIALVSVDSGAGRRAAMGDRKENHIFSIQPFSLRYASGRASIRVKSLARFKGGAG